MATAVEQNAITTTLKSWPERIKTFYSDVRTEMRKVNSPSRKEVQATTTVVIITVLNSDASTGRKCAPESPPDIRRRMQYTPLR